MIVRPEGRLFFANAQQVGERIQQLVSEHRPTVLILDLSRVFDIEYSALQAMAEGRNRLADKGVEVWLAGLNPDVAPVVIGSGLADQGAGAPVVANARDALRRYLQS